MSRAIWVTAFILSTAAAFLAGSFTTIGPDSLGRMSGKSEIAAKVPSKPQVDIQRAPQENALDLKPTAALVQRESAWRYEDVKDDMSDAVAKTACTDSGRSSLCFMRYPNGRLAAFMNADIVGLLCPTHGCEVEVRADDRETFTLGGSRKTQHAIQIADADHLFQEVRSANSIKVRTSFAGDDGAHQFVFDVKGLLF